MSSFRKEDYVLVLLRHASSAKNTMRRLSGSLIPDSLADRGIRQAETVGRALASIAQREGPCDLAAAQSQRARDTAQVLATAIGVAGFETIPIGSISMGAATGRTEAELRTEWPQTFSDLHLYRCGVLNSYDLRMPPGAEDQRGFEARVWGELEKAVQAAASRWGVFVLHRSPITSICIGIARRTGHYPTNFYGYVQLGPCRAYVVVLQRSGARIIGANLAAHAMGCTVRSCLERKRLSG